jgi:hypothetical protein
MDKRNFSNWIKEYMQYSAQSEAPNQFHFWTAVSCIAGALRRKVWIDMGYFEWTPNFYIVFVAPPGIVSKSTTANIGMNLLRRVPGIKFGPDAVTWQSLVKSLGDSTEGFFWPDDSIINPMSAITIVSSEFGNFLNPHDREMVDVLVSLWDGQKGVFKKSTKTQGDDSIENPWVNIIACTTPDWIAGNFPEYMIGGGFTSRTIFVYGEEKRQLMAYPADFIPAGFEQYAQKLTDDLEYISSKLAGPYSLSPDAKAWGVKWYEDHYKNKPAHLEDDKFGGYVARKQTHVHKLAMVLAAAQRDELIIERDDLEAAAGLVTSTEIDMPKVFAKISGDDARHAAQIVSILGKYGRIQMPVLFRMMFNTCTYEQFSAALTSTINAGYVTLMNTTEGHMVVPTAAFDKKFKVDVEKNQYGSSNAAAR